MRMIRLLSILLVGAALCPAASLAQDVEADSLRPSAKSPLVAAGIEYLVPTLGHAYAGDWSRGLPPAALIVAGVVLGVTSDCDESSCAGFIAGLGMALAGKVWGIFSAADTAQARNAATRVGLAFDPATRRPALEIRVPW